MSRKKHNISYIKPNEPKFLRELKEQIGYKEGPTIDTKVTMADVDEDTFQKYAGILTSTIVSPKLKNYLNYKEVLPEVSDDEKEELADEKPVVVVLSSGDLTAEEADAIKKQKEKEENNAPADLSKKIVFRKTKVTETDNSDTIATDKPVKKKAKKEKQKIALSFDTNDDDEDDVG